MTDLLAFLAFGAFLLAIAITIASRLARRVRQHRRRRRHERRALLDREIADALAPFGADISVWPSRAPQNGTTEPAD